MLKIFIFLASAAALVPAAAESQRRPNPLADSSAAQIIARYMRTDSLAVSREVLIDILRQRDRPQPPAKLDEIADHFAQIAIAARSGPGNETGYMAASAALSALRTAGAPGDSGYTGVLDRLIRIHKEAGPTPIRSSALRSMTSVASGPDRARALAYLREVTLSLDGTAPYALDALITEANSGGYAHHPQPARDEALAILRDLFMRDAVKDRDAWELLYFFGLNRGWRREPY